MRKNLPRKRRFRRETLHHGHWCDVRDWPRCVANPCQFAARWMLTQDKPVTIAVTATGADTAIVRLLGEDGALLTMTPAEVDEFVVALEDAATIARGSWPEYFVA